MRRKAPYLPGTKYVVESRGQFVRRYVELPNGRRIRLATRKALTCSCLELQQISITPGDDLAVAGAPSRIIA
jgi:hypothetical protein